MLDGVDVFDFVLAPPEAFAVAAVDVAFGLELDFRDALAGGGGISTGTSSSSHLAKRFSFLGIG